MQSIALALLVLLPFRVQEFPDTPAGKLAREYMQAFNSGKVETMREFENKHRSEAAKKARPIDQRLDVYRNLHAELGSLDVRRVSAGDAGVRVVAFSAAANEWVTLGFELDESSRLQGIRVSRSADEPPADQPLNDEERAAVIRSLVQALESTYVFPKTAAQMIEAVQSAHADGKYDHLNDAESFAARLTADLQSVSRDKHLRVSVRSDAGPRRGGGARHPNHGFSRVEVLPGNIGYLKLDGFAGGADAEPTAAAAMAFLANCDAIIFDLRENGGGSPHMIRFLSGYLFDKPTHLNDFYDRLTGETTSSFSRDDVPGQSMASKPVYVLTSSRTFSAAEEFTYNLKSLKRATIVGEQTGGGAHPVTMRRLTDRFAAMMPYARAINPITKTNWEGVGVEPDIAVPAAEALDSAATRAREAIRVERRSNDASR